MKADSLKNSSSKIIWAGAALILFSAIGVAPKLLKSFNSPNSEDARVSSSISLVQKSSARSTTAGTTLPGNDETTAIESEFVELLTNITPASAEAFLGRLRTEIPDIRIRASIGGSIIEALCRAGYTEESWRLIDADFGILRDFQLRSYFSVCRDNGAVQKIGGLTDQNEKNRAIDGFLSNRDYEDLLSMDFTKFETNRDFQEILTNQLILKMFHGNTPIEGASGDPGRHNSTIISDAINLANSGIISPDNLYELIKTDEFSDAFGHMDSLNSLDPSLWKSKLAPIIPKVVDKMLVLDAARTLEVIMDLPYAADLKVIEYSIDQWLIIDNRGATEWQHNQTSTLSQNQSDRVAAGFSTHAAAHGEDEVAQQWLNQIADNKIRVELSEKLKLSN